MSTQYFLFVKGHTTILTLDIVQYIINNTTKEVVKNEKR